MCDTMQFQNGLVFFVRSASRKGLWNIICSSCQYWWTIICAKTVYEYNTLDQHVCLPITNVKHYINCLERPERVRTTQAVVQAKQQNVHTIKWRTVQLRFFNSKSVASLNTIIFDTFWLDLAYYLLMY